MAGAHDGCQFAGEVDLDYSKLKQYDEDLSTVLRMEVMKDFKKDSSESELQDSSAFGLLVKFWREIDQTTGLMKRLPAIFTGSVMEGCSLARLFDPNSNSLEFEIDIMLLAGYLDVLPKEEHNDVFEDIPDRAGFFYLKQHRCLHLLPHLPGDDLGDLTVACNGRTYISGNLLKVKAQSLQPSASSFDQRLQVHGNYVVYRDICHGLEGPSAALSLKIQPLKYDDICLVVRSHLEKLKEIHIFMSRVVSLIKGVVLAPIVKSMQETAFASCFRGDPKVEIPACSLRLLGGYMKLFWLNSALCAHALRFLQDLAQMFVGTPKLQECVDAFSKNVVQPQKAYPKVHESMEGIYWDDANRNEPNVLLDVVSVIRLVSVLPMIDDMRNHFQSTWDVPLGIINTAIECLSGALREFEASRYDKITSPEFRISVDHVPCLYCPFWPPATAEFCTRSRCWPSADVIAKISGHGCFCVAKDCDNGIQNLTWRWSFSMAEISLVNHQSEKQRKCYFLFKASFYGYLKFKVDGRSLPSYLAKTCMLHLCERMPAHWWDQTSVIQCVLSLLEFLRSGLHQRKVQHFFMSDFNLLASLPDSLMQQIAVRISNILRDKNFLPRLLQSNACKIDTAVSDFRASSIACSSLRRCTLKIEVHPISETICRISAYKDMLLRHLVLRLVSRHLFYNINYRINLCSRSVTIEGMRRMKQKYDFAKAQLSAVGCQNLCHGNLQETGEVPRKEVMNSSEFLNTVRVYEAFLPYMNDQLVSILQMSTMFRVVGDFAVRENAKFMKWYCTICDFCQSSIECGALRLKCACGLDLCTECDGKSSSATEMEHVHYFEASTSCYETCFIGNGIRELSDVSDASDGLSFLSASYARIVEEILDTYYLLGPTDTVFLKDLSRPLDFEHMFKSVEVELEEFQKLIRGVIDCESACPTGRISSSLSSPVLEDVSNGASGISQIHPNPSNEWHLNGAILSGTKCKSEVILESRAAQPAMVTNVFTSGAWFLPSTSHFLKRMVLTTHPNAQGDDSGIGNSVSSQSSLRDFEFHYGVNHHVLQYRDCKQLHLELDSLRSCRVLYSIYIWFQQLNCLLKGMHCGEP